MKLPIIIAAALMCILPGCSTPSGTSTTPADIAQNAEPFVRPGTAAVTNVILLSQSAEKREAIAAKLYSASVAVYALATGAAMTPEAIEAAVASVATGDDAKQIAEIAKAVMSVYSGVYPAIKDKSPEIVRKIVSDVAAGLQDAASVYIPKQNPS